MQRPFATRAERLEPPNFEAPGLPSIADRVPEQSQSGAIRETINLLESDLGIMIRDVQRACGLVCQDSGDSASATQRIAQDTNRLVSQADAASRDLSQLAAAIDELARASDDIGVQVRKADDLSNQADKSATEAKKCVDGLKQSSAEIVHVIKLISAVARQTNMLALNATIEASRAGDAGRGFAVVAAEVKKLSQTTQMAAQDISQMIGTLQKDAIACFDSVRQITEVIKTMRPLFAAVASAVDQQNGSTSDVAHSANITLKFIDAVSHSATEIGAAALGAGAKGHSAEQRGRDVSALAEKLKMRMTIFLRQSEAGDRRRHDRLPCELGVEFQAGGATFRGKTGDLSDGGMLLRVDDAAAIPPGALLETEIAGIGPARVRVADRSSLGLHLEFLELSAAARSALEHRLAAFREENRAVIARAIDTANEISRRLDQLIDSNQITIEDLFDNNYVPNEGTDPVQFRTRFLGLLEGFMPSILDPLLAGDPRMVFCAAVDRNGYLPVHNGKYALPQRPGEQDWNHAHCRNRRIFDDRAGLAAARNVRPYLIQVYARDMGEGTAVMTREIDAPIRVGGRHWGAFRSAYTL